MSPTLPTIMKRTAALFLLAAVACKSTPPTNFYVLTSLADADAAADVASARAVTGRLLVVGPVELPDYLDQPAIVTRASANTLVMADFDHWAERLPEGFTRVLAEDLAQLLPQARIELFPWTRRDASEVQVIVRVARFEVVSGVARLTAEWQLDTGAEGEVSTQRGSFTEAVTGEDYAGMVSAMSGTLTQLSREIAAGIGE